MCRVAPSRIDPVRSFVPEHSDRVLIDIAFDLHVREEFVGAAKRSAGQVLQAERVWSGVRGRVRIYCQ